MRVNVLNVSRTNYVDLLAVGVIDERSYENVVALRVVDSQDGMTADWVALPAELLRKISNRILNEVRGVNRGLRRIIQAPGDHRVGVNCSRDYSCPGMRSQLREV